MDLFRARPTYHRVPSPGATSHHELQTVPPEDDGRSPREQDLPTANVANKRSGRVKGTIAPVRGLINRLRHRLPGFRTGGLAAASLATFTLIVNIVAFIILKVQRDPDSTMANLFRGDCDKVEKMQLWSHLIINVLGTVLLSGSNYCMQVLCAPTRQDIDVAHQKGKHLSVGVQSPRNLLRIKWWRVLMWLVLSLSSVPLHLMYKSAFFSSIAAMDYNIYFVGPDQRPYYEPQDSSSRYEKKMEHLSYLLSLPASSPEVERLDKKACINAYAVQFLTARSNLIIVATDQTMKSGGVPEWHGVNEGSSDYDAFDWICYSSVRMGAHFEGLKHALESISEPPCDQWISEVKDKPEFWTPYDLDVDYCLSERIDEQCGFHGNPDILLVVIICNALKALCMLFVAFGITSGPLVTTGDALSSFLQDADTTTKSMCLLSRTHIKRGATRMMLKYFRKRDLALSSLYPPEGQVAKPSRQRWWKAASTLQWFLTILPTLCAIGVVASFFYWGYRIIAGFGVSMSNIGFGKIHGLTLVDDALINEYIGDPYSSEESDMAKRLLASVLVVNTPQIILSVLYLSINNLLTCMWLAAELSDYSRERKPLRVSDAKGQQRSTYFLQITYRVSIPLIIISGLLHWLVSQSIFLAVVSNYNWDESLFESLYVATYGLSLHPMIGVMVVGGSLCVAVIGVGIFGKLSGTGFMPIMGSNSLALAAACHRPSEDEGAELKPVQWGAIPGDEHSDEDDVFVGHCSFTSGPVEELVERRRYK